MLSNYYYLCIYYLYTSRSNLIIPFWFSFFILAEHNSSSFHTTFPLSLFLTPFLIPMQEWHIVLTSRERKSVRETERKTALSRRRRKDAGHESLPAEPNTMRVSVSCLTFDLYGYCPFHTNDHWSLTDMNAPLYIYFYMDEISIMILAQIFKKHTS